MILLLYQLSYAAMEGEESLQHGALVVNEPDCKAHPTVLTAPRGRRFSLAANETRISLSLKGKVTAGQAPGKRSEPCGGRGRRIPR